MSPGCRIRSFTLKQGGLRVYVLPDRTAEDRATVLAWVRLALEQQNAPVSGFAFVVWDRDSTSTVACRVHDPTIPAIMVPDFVKNRLMADRIEKWTIDAIDRRE